MILWIAAALCCAAGYCAYCLYGGMVVFSIVFDPQTPKERAFENFPAKKLDNQAEKARLSAWFDEHAEDVFITARDGARLCGKLFRAKKDSGTAAGVIICMHGFRSNVYQMAGAAARFSDAGWDALAPWQRCHGQSGGVYHGMGYLEHFDALDWAAWAAANGAKNIVLYGISMGAAAVMMAAGEREALNIPVKAIIADCGFSSIADQVSAGVRRAYPKTYHGITAAGSLVTKLRAGFFWKDGACTEYVRRSPIPKLFIHGTADAVVPFEAFQKLFGAAREPKKKLEVPGAGHAASQTEIPALYWSAADSFLRENSLTGVSCE
ncbi:MAG: alpha/beta hydrolase [Treponemataceae bacterium]|nr:MAG: alpha/beta hydrolase [Treponemataceae bacterium]